MRYLVATFVVAITVGCGDGHRSAPMVEHSDVIAIGTQHEEQQKMPVVPGQKAKPITAAQSRRAIRLAEKRWGGNECVVKIAIRRANLFPLDVIAVVRWKSGLPGGKYLDCSITVNSRRISLPFPFYCAVISHMVGHFSGFYERGGLDSGIHSRNPNSVMYPSLSAANIPSYCKT